MRGNAVIFGIAEKGIRRVSHRLLRQKVEDKIFDLIEDAAAEEIVDKRGNAEGIQLFVEFFQLRQVGGKCVAAFRLIDRKAGGEQFCREFGDERAVFGREFFQQGQDVFGQDAEKRAELRRTAARHILQQLCGEFFVRHAHILHAVHAARIRFQIEIFAVSVAADRDALRRIIRICEGAFARQRDDRFALFFAEINASAFDGKRACVVGRRFAADGPLFTDRKREIFDGERIFPALQAFAHGAEQRLHLRIHIAAAVAYGKIILIDMAERGGVIIYLFAAALGAFVDGVSAFRTGSGHRVLHCIGMVAALPADGADAVCHVVRARCGEPLFAADGADLPFAAGGRVDIPNMARCRLVIGNIAVLAAGAGIRRIALRHAGGRRYRLFIEVGKRGKIFAIGLAAGCALVIDIAGLGAGRFFAILLGPGMVKFGKRYGVRLIAARTGIADRAVFFAGGLRGAGGQFEVVPQSGRYVVLQDLAAARAYVDGVARCNAGGFRLGNAVAVAVFRADLLCGIFPDRVIGEVFGRERYEAAVIYRVFDELDFAAAVYVPDGDLAFVFAVFQYIRDTDGNRAAELRDGFLPAERNIVDGRIADLFFQLVADVQVGRGFAFGGEIQRLAVGKLCDTVFIHGNGDVIDADRRVRQLIFIDRRRRSGIGDLGGGTVPAGIEYGTVALLFARVPVMVFGVRYGRGARLFFAADGALHLFGARLRTGGLFGNGELIIVDDFRTGLGYILHAAVAIGRVRAFVGAGIPYLRPIAAVRPGAARKVVAELITRFGIRFAAGKALVRLDAVCRTGGSIGNERIFVRRRGGLNRIAAGVRAVPVFTGGAVAPCVAARRDLHGITVVAEGAFVHRFPAGKAGCRHRFFFVDHIIVRELRFRLRIGRVAAGTFVRNRTRRGAGSADGIAGYLVIVPQSGRFFRFENRAAVGTGVRRFARLFAGGRRRRGIVFVLALFRAAAARAKGEQRRAQAEDRKEQNEHFADTSLLHTISSLLLFSHKTNFLLAS